jgi:hypothetical protein
MRNVPEFDRESETFIVKMFARNLIEMRDCADTPPTSPTCVGRSLP